MYPNPRISQEWPIGDGLGHRKASQWGMTWPAYKQFLAILQVCGECLAGRENCFQQSDKFAGHVGEVHLHSVGL